ncbi:TonB-dependent siderophore receptor [Aquabacterium sp. J223]|uniref:TonB-dependent receptor plug domain-containing protein n=1 Tax=Aquabacterium sp. J223 TaxID=2898431 RepID=UPI0021ADBADA|nr:TonB-dependent receptor [Aquabacterium sp. J223]UUX93960.1 TonB-dependent receptor [Aquabacterium sp. J223]
MSMPARRLRLALPMPWPLAACGLVGLGSAVAQPQPGGGEPAPLPSQQVEIRGTRQSADIDLRRNSTAAKIVIGREDIERFGDQSLGETLRRLPGVTLDGAPGRGGAVRMRGLGGGYTQLLIDGERVPPGFSFDQLSPEQVERIEVLRAPTAETGARAIAGTINIVTREGFTRRLNDLKLGLGGENQHLRPGATWSRNGSLGDFSHNTTVSLWQTAKEADGSFTSTRRDLASGAVTQQRFDRYQGLDERTGLSASSRLQWRLGEGRSLMLTPSLFTLGGSGHRDTTSTGSYNGSTFDRVRSDDESRFSVARLQGLWRHRLADGTRLETRGSANSWQARNDSLRQDFGGGALQRTVDDRSRTRERGLNLSVKGSKLLDNDHSLVGGVETEWNWRDENRRVQTTFPNASTQPSPIADDLGAQNQRWALYLQDEWSLSPQWALHAGLRGETILTRGDLPSGVAQSNRSTVWSPLLHALWKPDPKGRDQVRLSLTRSYKSPTLRELIGVPRLAGNSGADVTNAPTDPDRIGNATLQPELATGLDLAFERYPAAGGVLSAGVFHRRISNVIRSQVSLENVPWSTVPRYVARPQNVGDATVQGVEFDSRFRLDQWWTAAPAVDLRFNASVFRSVVDGVPGPDNRLDRQPKASLNVGGDYRLRGGLPLTVGGNLGVVPGYRVQVAANQDAVTGRKRVIDAYALWTVDPTTQLRLTASNLSPLDATGQTGFVTATTRDSVDASSRSYLSWQLRLEMKL